MTFSTFATSPLDGFLKSGRSEHAFWFFLHIPKTAGTSMTAELDKMRPPYVNIGIDYARDAADHDAALRRAVDRFKLEAAQARSASGHITAELLPEISRARPGARFVTILRDPVARVVSDYVYQTTPAHPPFEAFRKRYPTIEQYILDPAEQNKMFLFASGARTAPDFDAAYKAIEQRFGFIGLTELYPMSLNIISRLMGQPVMPSEHQRRTSAEAKAQVVLTPTLIGLIRQVNHLDQKLYDRVAGALLPKLSEWRALQGVAQG